MRAIAILLVSSLFMAGCSGTMASPEPRTAKQEIQLRKALAGKVAQKPVDCLPSFSSSNMEIVDDHTLLFHDGGRVFLQSPRGGCSPLGRGQYTLVTELHGSSSLCRGDISRVVDLTGGGMTVGSCSMDSFIPYVKPRA